MKVGLVTDFYYPWIGGPAILIRNLSQGFVDRGHTVSVLAPSPTGAPTIENEESVSITRIRTVGSPVGYELRVAMWPRAEIGRWLDCIQPDVVHVHHPFPISATAIFEARRRGIPVAATNHTIPECSLWGVRSTGMLYRTADSIFSRWIVMLMNRCDAVATPTRTAARLLTGLGYGGKVEPISNGVDISRFRPGVPDVELRRQLGLDERPIVLYTGRLDAEKQMDVWLRAAAQVARTMQVQLVVGGKGSERVRLQALARSLDLEDSLTFIGYLPDEVFPALYRLATVYFITSPVELQSISTLEALASGLPVVAVRAGALPELVKDGVNGFLVSPGDTRNAAWALEHLLADSNLQSEMGQESRAAALGHDLQESISGYERFLQRVVHPPSGALHFERAPVAGG